MPELIDRQAVRLLESDDDAYTENWNADYERGFCDAINKVLELPTIEAEPVRNGRWQPFYKDHGIKYYICSECSETSISNKYPYCHCGAKMDGGADNG